MMRNKYFSLAESEEIGLSMKVLTSLWLVVCLSLSYLF